MEAFVGEELLVLGQEFAGKWVELDRDGQEELLAGGLPWGVEDLFKPIRSWAALVWRRMKPAADW